MASPVANVPSARLTWNSLRLSRRGEDIFSTRGKGGPAVAQKLSVTYACDFDEREIPQGQHRLRRFSIDGRDYEIDLCLRHSERFDEAVSSFATHARKASARPVRTKRRTAAHRKHSAQVRAWARANGFALSERGRIPSDVVSRYESTHS